MLVILGDGLNDHVTCFCCGQSVKEWEVSDEPWTTHARFSPTCSYLLLSKGYEFVQTVLISGPPVLTIKNNAIERYFIVFYMFASIKYKICLRRIS